MKTPTIHLNGTAGGELFAGYMEALEAVRTAQAALAKVAPHGRDYYPQGADAIHAAIGEHVRRMDLLEIVRYELDDLAAYCLEQQLAQTERRAK